MTGRERKDKRMDPLRDSNNKLVHDDNEKAETMNKFFSTIGQELSSNFKTLDHAVNIQISLLIHALLIYTFLRISSIISLKS